jgi:DNA replication licensing factor MCM7
VIDLDDIDEFDTELANNIIGNTKRYTQLFSDVIFELLPHYRQKEVVAKDSLDVYIEHRLVLRQQHHGDQPTHDMRNLYPPDLIRKFEVHFKHRSRVQPLSVREVRSNEIGKLVNVRGIVTRATEVKPVMVVATYTCDQCAAESYQPVRDQLYCTLAVM